MNSTNLRTIRLKLGFSQANMAKMLNTPVRTYQRWELDNRFPGVVEVAVDGVLLAINQLKKVQENENQTQKKNSSV